jgi:hypothetical protein
VSEEKFSKCEEGGGGYLSMEFRVFEKKGIRRKILKEKKSKCFLWRKKKKIKIFVVKEKLKLGENIQVK